jgi:phosphatidylinositol alpha-mannosyltransferase
MHLHEPLAPSITLAALLSRAAPVVGTFHAAGHRTPYKYFRVPLRRVAGRIDVRVAVSDAARELAQHQLGGDFETLFNGIDLCAYTDALPTPVDRPTILFLGRHEPRKGLEVLLEAFTSMPDDIALWVGGDGPERARLQSRYGADRRIRWLGRVDESAKISHLRAASVVCAPSLHGESFGMILLEAMAARTPVVASDLPGYRALGADGAAASLVAPGDPAALVAGLRRVLSNPRLGEELRAAGSVRVAEFGLDGLAKRYEAIYRRLLLRDG